MHVCIYTHTATHTNTIYIVVFTTCRSQARTGKARLLQHGLTELVGAHGPGTRMKVSSKRGFRAASRGEDEEKAKGHLEYEIGGLK